MSVPRKDLRFAASDSAMTLARKLAVTLNVAMEDARAAFAPGSFFSEQGDMSNEVGRVKSDSVSF
jgi:hypothetical protein